MKKLNWLVSLYFMMACPMVNADPREVVTLVQKARQSYFLGKSQVAEPLPRFEEGLAAAEEARELAPNDPAAIIWWAANKGAIADIKRNLAALKTIKEIEGVLLKLKAKAPAFGYAAADRALGVLYHKAPGFISIGSNKKAEKHLREAVALAPEYPGNHLALADFLEATDKPEEAAKIVSALLENAEWRSKDYGDFSPERAGWEVSLSKPRVFGAVK